MKRKISWIVGLVLLLCLIFVFYPESSEVLTKEQKEQYYQEYLKIADEVRKEYPNSLDFNVVEIEQIREDDWVLPVQFQNKIIPIITEKKGVIDLPFVTFTVKAPTKYEEIFLNNEKSLGEVVINSTVSVAFDPILKHPVINDVTDVDSYTTLNDFNWEQVSSKKTANVNDNYSLTVFGELSLDEVVFPEALTISYTFNKNGFIE